MGVTIENDRVVHRIDALRKIPAYLKFLSIEPLLTALPNLNLLGIDWVIVGGESGHKARPIQRNWVIDIRDRCSQNHIPFFFKQWGGRNKKAAGKLLDGRIYCQMPFSYSTQDSSSI
jgi:protein gp37